MDMFFVMLIKPFLLMAMLVVGYPITYYVKHKMKHGALRDLLLQKIS